MPKRTRNQVPPPPVPLSVPGEARVERKETVIPGGSCIDYKTRLQCPHYRGGMCLMTMEAVTGKWHDERTIECPFGFCPIKVTVEVVGPPDPAAVKEAFKH